MHVGSHNKEPGPYNFHPTWFLSIGVVARVLRPTKEDTITTVDSSVFSNRDFPQRMTLQIPAELIRMFVTMSGRDDGRVRTVGAVYNNIGRLLPSTRPQMNE